MSECGTYCVSGAASSPIQVWVWAATMSSNQRAGRAGNENQRTMPLWRDQLRSGGRSSLVWNLPLHRLPSFDWVCVQCVCSRSRRELRTGWWQSKNLCQSRGRWQEEPKQVLRDLRFARIFAFRVRSQHLSRSSRSNRPACCVFGSRANLATLGTALGRLDIFDPSPRRPATLGQMAKP